MNKENLSPELTFSKNIFLQNKWEDYYRRINILSSSNPEEWETIDFPVEISLELTNYCNLECIMCPVPNLKRCRGFMDETVFRKIVKDISNESGFLFLPQGFGELLLHKKWYQLIEFAYNSGIQPIVVLTNGMLFNETNIRKILNIVDTIIVTIDGITAKTYESVRVKGSLEKVNKNIERFLEIRKHKETPHLILRIIRMKETEKEIEPFNSYWSKRIGNGDIIQIFDCIDWAGNITYKSADEIKSKKGRRPCKMLWKNLSIYHNGQVSPCCYDAEGELIVGNILHQGLKEIWNDSMLRNLRNLHLTYQFEKIPLCSGCKDWL